MSAHGVNIETVCYDGGGHELGRFDWRAPRNWSRKRALDYALLLARTRYPTHESAEATVIEDETTGAEQ